MSMSMLIKKHEREAKRGLPSAQDAVDAFVTTQLLDNGMDAVAKKINRLRAKLQPADGDAPELDPITKKKYAKRLQHWLLVAYRLLHNQWQQLNDAIDVVDRDLKTLTSASTSSQPDASSRDLYLTPAQLNTAAAASSSASFQFTAAAAAFALSNEPILGAGRFVAAKVARSHELWILARIVRFSEVSNTYEVEDVDAGDRHHIVPKHQVVELQGDVLPEGKWIQYAVNQRVMAMYPNTTSFYRATIRVPNPKGAPYVILKFEDDADEIGQVPDRKVPFRFVTPLKPWHKH
uniref:SGF29 C-terminal domain-containing protein n=1 Tax=Globisporangium ultimum (strain ATCC 200006 / CBS 805.95 / DAOM BR144) TaxID=431595 RepID=K3X8Q5_GLOUD